MAVATCAQRRDLGVQIYENLQFGLPRSPAHQEQLLRKVDGVVQLAQKYGQVYFPGLLVGYNAAASDDRPGRPDAYCAAILPSAIAGVPGLIYYLNGDYRCQLSDAVTPQWNEFLRERYGSEPGCARPGAIGSRRAARPDSGRGLLTTGNKLGTTSRPMTGIVFAPGSCGAGTAP